MALDRIKVVYTDEAELQRIKEAAQKTMAPGARVLRDQLYPVKVDNANRTAILDLYQLRLRLLTQKVKFLFAIIRGCSQSLQWWPMRFVADAQETSYSDQGFVEFERLFVIEE